MAAIESTPLIVIVGETASGKSALAMTLAKKFHGEIICADSRTIYTDMNIGTAKPSKQDQVAIPHHLIDIISPDEQFSAANFKIKAIDAIDAVATKGNVPLLVGGTGLYVDAVVFDFQFGNAADTKLRSQLELRTIEELHDMLRDQGIVIPENSKNKRYLIRAMERRGNDGGRTSLRANTLVLGMSVDKQNLKQRIVARVDTMVETGFVEEYRALRIRYDADAPGFSGTGYKAFEKYMDGSISLEEAKAEFVRNDWKLAKRQRTWFKRNKSIRWVSNEDEAVEIVTTFLNKYRSKP